MGDSKIVIMLINNQKYGTTSRYVTCEKNKNERTRGSTFPLSVVRGSQVQAQKQAQPPAAVSDRGRLVYPPFMPAAIYAYGRGANSSRCFVLPVTEYRSLAFEPDDDDAPWGLAEVPAPL